jgi:hypothetical protein
MPGDGARVRLGSEGESPGRVREGPMSPSPADATNARSKECPMARRSRKIISST